jgi:hypothetical protein
MIAARCSGVNLKHSECTSQSDPLLSHFIHVKHQHFSNETITPRKIFAVMYLGQASYNFVHKFLVFQMFSEKQKIAKSLKLIFFSSGKQIRVS